MVAGGNKKMKDVKDIGEFKTKYKANEKTKNLITKHAKEAAEHLLKLSNSKVDGIDKEENGFFMTFKAGGRTFIASEGVVGKKFVEDEDYRDTIIGASKTIDVQLNNTLLTSMLKAQYGTAKEVNTPKSHKRKNYNGIGGQAKKKAKPTEDTADKSKKKKKTVSVDASSESDEPVDSDPNAADEVAEPDDENRWLEEMIQEETEPIRPSKSKKTIKEARQLFPFKCSECSAKYKTKTGYEKHLREKHGLI